MPMEYKYLKQCSNILTEIDSYIPDDSVYHPMIDVRGNIWFTAWKKPGNLAEFGSDPNSPARLAEWTVRKNAPEIFCKMCKGKLKFKVEPGAEELTYYQEAKDIVDRLNNNTDTITKFVKELKTEITQDWKKSRGFK